jgi:hypothetical protein
MPFHLAQFGGHGAGPVFKPRVRTPDITRVIHLVELCLVHAPADSMVFG